MASVTYTAKGANLLIASTAVLQLISIQPTAPKYDFEDITNLSSPQQGNVIVQEQVPVELKAGEVTAQGYYLPGDAGRTALQTAYNNAALSTFTIQLNKAPSQANVGDAYNFSGYVTTMPMPDTLQANKAITYKVGIMVTGNVTYVQGS